MSNFLEKHYQKIVLVILAFMLFVSTWNAWWDGAIFDETAHIPAGYSYLKEKDMRLNPEHPPLLKDLAGLPLIFMNLGFDTGAKFWKEDINGQWDAGRNLLWQVGNDADQIIFWSRLPIVILSIVLGWFIFFWTRELAGILAGIFALILYAFDPNILGHNHFVTTDLGIAAFGAFSFYFFLKFIREPSWKNVFWGGLFLGLLQLAKFSSITFFPIYGLVLLIYPLTKINRHGNASEWPLRIKKLSEYLGKGAIAFLLSLLVVWGVYFATIYKMPKEKVNQTIEFYFPSSDQNAKSVFVNKTARLLNEKMIGRPLSYYFLGIAMVMKRVDGGNGAYFMGEVSSSAFGAYFPTVFLIKEPLPSLFFMLLALSIVISRGLVFIFRKTAYHLGSQTEKREKKFCLADFLRHHITKLSLFAFVFLYSYISVTGNLNIGFRHLFPILPFVYILSAKVIFDFLRKMKKESLFIWRFSLLGISLFLIFETVSAFPYYMSYFNQTVGGPQKGFAYVTDSNADWGQDIKRLKKWIGDYNECAENLTTCKKCCYSVNNLPKYPFVHDLGKIDEIHINYFGGGDIFYYFKDLAIDWWDSKRPLEPGWYALSTNYLMGSIYDQTKKDSESYRWTKNIKPLAQVGTSIFIYYLTPEDIAGISK